MANYIYTACTDPSISGITSANTSNYIIGYDNTTLQLTGCMSYAGQTTLLDATIEIVAEGFSDCNDCLSDTNAYRFVSCCDSISYNYFIPNSGATAYTFGEVYVMDGVCFTLDCEYTGGPVVGTFTGTTSFTTCSACTESFICPTPTPTPTLTQTPTPTPSLTDYQIQLCCTGDYVVISGYTGTLTISSVYYFNGTGINECATVVPYSGTGSVILATDLSFVSPQLSCELCEAPPCSPTPTPTVTMTPTVTPTVTYTPTPTPTTSVTPTPTRIRPAGQYQFSACCSPYEVFKLTDVPEGSINEGEVYEINTVGFSGCATVIIWTNSGSTYSGVGALATGPYVDCSSCEVCPTATPTVTPTNTVTPTVTPTITATPPPCLDTNWIIWTGATGGYFDLIGGGTIDLTSVSPGSALQSVFGYSRLVCPDKNPSGNVQGIQNAGTYTYTFSQPVTNPLLAVYSLGRDVPSPITASLSADTAFTVYCSGTSNPSYAITYDLLNQSFSGTEGYGIVQFVGTVTQINLNYSPFEQYTQLSWGIPCIGIPPSPTPTPTVTQTPTVTPTITKTPTQTPTPTKTPSYPTQCGGPCLEVRLENLSTTSISEVSYRDCLDNDIVIILAPAEIVFVCYCEGSLIVPSGVNAVLTGNECSPWSPSPTPSNNPTPTPTPTIPDNPTGCTISTYCLDTNYSGLSSYDGTYVTGGTYNGYYYYTLSGGTGYIFYDGGKWCLSNSLGGSCLLSGKEPCNDECPDLCDDLFVSGSCTTTTTTTTIPFDFNAYFDCAPSPTPVVSPSYTPQPTRTPTPTPSINPCNGTAIDITIIVTGTTTTTTSTTTTTTSRDVGVSGETTYTISEVTVICPSETYELEDCVTGDFYYIYNEPKFGTIALPTGTVFKAYINNVLTCVTFTGLSSTSPNSYLGTITNVYGTDCSSCS